MVRAQQSGGDPKLRYCGSLGHKQDDESGPVYMRARYYEPSSGRFVSEEPAECGLNYYTYASDDPLNRTDTTGKYDESSANASYLLLWIAVLGYVRSTDFACGISNCAKFIHASSCAFLAAYFLGDAEVGGSTGDKLERGNRLAFGVAIFAYSAAGATETPITSIAGEAVGAITQYTAFLGIFMAMDNLESQLQ